MLGIKRRRKPPAALRPALERDERIITWARTDAGEAVVVTTGGLFLPGHERLGWHQIHKASWSGPRLSVVPSMEVGPGDGYTVMADAPPIVVGLAAPGDVPEEVRRRVTRSVAFTHHQVLPDGGVRVVARRVAGRNGVIWHVRYDPGTDTADPAVVAFTAELVAEAAKPDEPD